AEPGQRPRALAASSIFCRLTGLGLEDDGGQPTLSELPGEQRRESAAKLGRGAGDADRNRRICGRLEELGCRCSGEVGQSTLRTAGRRGGRLASHQCKAEKGDADEEDRPSQRHKPPRRPSSMEKRSGSIWPGGGASLVGAVPSRKGSSRPGPEPPASLPVFGSTRTNATAGGVSKSRSGSDWWASFM